MKAVTVNLTFKTGLFDAKVFSKLEEMTCLQFFWVSECAEWCGCGVIDEEVEMDYLKDFVEDHKENMLYCEIAVYELSQPDYLLFFEEGKCKVEEG